MRTFAFLSGLGLSLACSMATDTGHAGAAPHPHVGAWITADGHIRHRLLPNGRYSESRGSRDPAYEGRYEITGNHIEYWDDTGFTADGNFIDGVLHHGGMILYREGTEQ